jgi:hypothetical protein
MVNFSSTFLHFNIAIIIILSFNDCLVLLKIYSTFYFHYCLQAAMDIINCVNYSHRVALK